MSKDEELCSMMSPEDEWYWKNERDSDESAEYDDYDEIVAEQKEILKILKDGKYKVRHVLAYCALEPDFNWGAGFNRAQMYWNINNGNQPIVDTQVLVGGHIFEYDLIFEEWCTEEYDDCVIEPLENWLNANIKLTCPTEKEILKLAIPTIAVAQDMLHGYQYYNINGDLYFYVNPIEEISDEKQKEIDNMMAIAKKLKRKEAAKLLKEGNYVLVDAPKVCDDPNRDIFDPLAGILKESGCFNDTNDDA